MDQLIRKLSVGPDYKTAMHYIRGQEVMGGLANIYDFTKEGLSWSIWISKDGEILKWKTFENMPISVEHDINF